MRYPVAGSALSLCQTWIRGGFEAGRNVAGEVSLAREFEGAATRRAAAEREVYLEDLRARYLARAAERKRKLAGVWQCQSCCEFLVNNEPRCAGGSARGASADQAADCAELRRARSAREVLAARFRRPQGGNCGEVAALVVSGRQRRTSEWRRIAGSVSCPSTGNAVLRATAGALLAPARLGGYVRCALPVRVIDRGKVSVLYYKFTGVRVVEGDGVLVFYVRRGRIGHVAVGDAFTAKEAARAAQVSACCLHSRCLPSAALPPGGDRRAQPRLRRGDAQ